MKVNQTQMNIRWGLSVLVFFAALGLTRIADANSKKTFDKNVQTQNTTIDRGVKSQKKIDKVASETKTLLDEYRITLRKIENTRKYNEQLLKLIQSQKDEMESIKKQIASIKNTNKEIVPLMARMIETLEKFVALDVPFLQKERQTRLTQLKTMMNRADVSTSEKYRRVLEAYQVENEYGRTLETYKGVRKVDGKDLTVNYLRMGRVALVYQTLDGKDSGYWLNKERKWVKLPGEYRKSIRKGVRVAKKQTAPNLLKLPILSPEVVK